MFEVGFSELMLIAVVALLVLGPEKLPGAARTVGGLVRRARDSWQSLQGELERELAATELKQSLGRHSPLPELESIGKELKSAVRDMDALLRPEAAAPAPPAAPAATEAPPQVEAATPAAKPDHD